MRMEIDLQRAAAPVETTTVLASQGVSAQSTPWSWLKVGLVVGLMGALYITILPDLASEWWTEPSSSYGLLIPPLAIGIAYMRRSVIESLPVRPDGRGLWLIAVGCLTSLLGNLAAEFFLSRISFVLILAGLTWTFWGWPRFRALLFPFVLLATMVPLPALVYNQIAAPLQLLASSLATFAAQALGISIYQDGNIIHLANISLGVAEACSGLQSLSAMVVASLLLGFVESASLLGRSLLLVLSVPLAVALNIVRVTGTAVLADYQPEFALGFYHLFTGWLVFLVGFSLLWLMGRLLFRWTRVSL